MTLARSTGELCNWRAGALGGAPGPLTRSRASQDVVAADALAPLHPPAEERAVEPQAAEVERGAAQDLARAAPRIGVLAGRPQLEAGAQLAVVGVVGRRQQRLDDRLRRHRRALEDRRRHRLVAMLGGLRGAHGAHEDAEVVAQPRADRAR